MKTRPMRILLLVLTMSALPGVAGAQNVVGEIADESRAPLSFAAIGLFDSSGEMVASTRSDAQGRFTVSAPGAGRYSLHLSRQAYRSLSGGPYDLVEGVDLEVFVVMHRAPITLDPVEVEVEGRSARLAASGFYERKAEGFGHFLDRAEILRRGGSTVAEALQSIPTVTVGQRDRLFGPDNVRHPGIVFRRGGLDCVPALWVDGAYRRAGGSQAEPLRIDDYVTIESVEGMEFYQGPASLPIEFSHSGACAVVLLWTRGGSDPATDRQIPSAGIA